ncbi:MAG: sigma-70 family RNA polymerase sigma factor [Planctomycetes bacterium]|nr:sigma-70 family RNA polymerase sigma factor [Planctomycetota bacterium]
MTDQELLRQYCQGNAAAFRELYERHVNAIYASCCRRLGKACEQLEDAVQTVFVILANKAGKIQKEVLLSGWLHRTAGYVCLKLLRDRARRLQHEQEVFRMKSQTKENQPSVDWRQVEPHLDDAIDHLPENQKSVMVMHFLEGMSLGQISERTGVSKNTIRTRVDLGLEKMRRFFSRRGVAVPSAALAAVMASNAIQVAPAAVVAGSYQSIAACAAGKGGSLNMAALQLSKATMKMIMISKIKTVAAAILAGILITSAGIGAGIIFTQTGGKQTAIAKVTRANDAQLWQPEKGDKSKLVSRPSRIVDYGDDYCHYRSDQFLYSGKTKDGKPRINVLTELDLTGDGKKNDSLSYLPFDLETPCIPLPWVDAHDDWDTDAASFRFYVARLGWLQNESICSITEHGGPNMDHSFGGDDINMMGWGVDRNNNRVKGWGLWLWQKDDFLHGGDQYKVSIDDNSRMGLHIPRYWENPLGRFVIRDGKQFYISQSTFRGGWGTTHAIKPLEIKWAKYDPKPPSDIIFDENYAEFAKMNFTDVTAAGYYIYTPEWLYELDAKLGAFEVIASVNSPQRLSDVVEMKEIHPDGNILPFYISSCEVPYRLYQIVHRWGQSNVYAFDARFEFDREPQMGSMAYDDAAHSPDEPVTGITWLDCVVWCNALSVMENLTPVYYEDDKFIKPLKKVVDRWHMEKPADNIYVRWEADGYRLPTFSEWNKAFIAGNPSVNNESRNRTGLCGASAPDKAGLYDMLGNVWEYVWNDDDSAISKRNKCTVVGGSFVANNTDSAMKLSASEYGDQLWRGRFDVGFRLVRRQAGLKSPGLSADPVSFPVWEFGINDKSDSKNESAIKQPEIPMISIPTSVLEYKTKTFAMPIIISALNASACEITYRQWKYIWHWAEAHGYKFNYTGDMGSMYLKTSGEHSQDEPVTRINWYDAVIWCNALSESTDKRPVYYLGADKDKRILRNSLDVRRIMLHGDGVAQRADNMEENDNSKRAKKDPSILKNCLSDFPKMIEMDFSADGYRLPTACEYELLQRGNAKSSYFWGNQVDGEYMWYKDNSRGSTHPVRMKKPNAFGLFDICGNVGEWLNDSAIMLNPYDRRNPRCGISWRGGANFGVAGGSFKHNAQWSMAGRSTSTTAIGGYPELGFRIVNCPYVPCLVINKKKYRVTGPLAEKVRSLNGKSIEFKGDINEESMTIELKEIKEVNNGR